jgi:hypothetical protein
MDEESASLTEKVPEGDQDVGQLKTVTREHIREVPEDNSREKGLASAKTILWDWIDSCDYYTRKDDNQKDLSPKRLNELIQSGALTSKDIIKIFEGKINYTAIRGNIIAGNRKFCCRVIDSRVPCHDGGYLYYNRYVTIWINESSDLIDEIIIKNKE